MSSQCVLIERCKYTPSRLKHSPICCLHIPNELLYDWRTSSPAGSYVACLNSTINGRIQISQENQRIEGLLRRKAGVLYSGIREANRQKNSTNKNKLLSKEYVLTVSTCITLALIYIIHKVINEDLIQVRELQQELDYVNEQVEEFKLVIITYAH